MTLNEYIAAHRLALSDVAADWGCTESFVSYVKTGTKPLPISKAILTYRKRGVKLTPIANASDDEIAALERFGV